VVTVINPFVAKAEAQRYHQYRPQYHALPFQQLKEFLHHRIEKALDVACGTGHSTKALAEICDQVIGCDISSTMLSEAKKNSNLEFVQSSAEQLCFGSHSFDYLNISMAFQWLNQRLFLSEAHRVLKTNGHLGIDNYGFTGKMAGHDSFRDQYREFDQKNMKPAARHLDYPEDGALSSAGFRQVHEIKYEQDVLMNWMQFVNYLMTRSNYLVLASDERPKIEIELQKFYEPLFEGKEKNLTFQGTLKLYQALG
jgi:ubiquinone/menaquinone biosynthesis C-methylase UbiE